MPFLVQQQDLTGPPQSCPPQLRGRRRSTLNTDTRKYFESGSTTVRRPKCRIHYFLQFGSRIWNLRVSVVPTDTELFKNTISILKNHKFTGNLYNNKKIINFVIWYAYRQSCGSGSVCFGPPGSGSVIILFGSGSGSGYFHQQAKKVRKNIDFYYFSILWLLCDFLSMKTEANVPWKSNKDFLLAGILSATFEKSRIRNPKSVVRIRGSGSVPNSHGSIPQPAYRTADFSGSWRLNSIV
jgi:hypothetical protein